MKRIKIAFIIFLIMTFLAGIYVILNPTNIIESMDNNNDNKIKSIIILMHINNTQPKGDMFHVIMKGSKDLISFSYIKIKINAKIV